MLSLSRGTANPDSLQIETRENQLLDFHVSLVERPQKPDGRVDPVRRDTLSQRGECQRFRASVCTIIRRHSERRKGRDGRVAEGARLESVFTRKGNVGSNPTLSAIFSMT